MCISFSQMRTLFFCGHRSGVISAWSPDSQVILKLMGLTQIHDGPINRIFFKDTIVGNTMSQFVMSCSSDSYIKVFKSDESFEMIASKSYESAVLDIYQTFDYEKNEFFVISLENGQLLIVNMALEIVFKIPSMLNSKKRFIINIENPFKGETEGNFFIISDGNSININIWIKQGSIDKKIQNLTQPQFSRGGGNPRGNRGGRYQDGNLGGQHGRGQYYRRGGY